jgi:hypothetical protein
VPRQTRAERCHRTHVDGICITEVQRAELSLADAHRVLPAMLQDAEHLRGRGGLADVEPSALQIEGVQEDARVMAAIADAVEARGAVVAARTTGCKNGSAGVPAPRR